MDVSFVDKLTQIINDLYGLLYQPFGLPIILVAIGGWLSIRTGLIQVRRFGTALKFVSKGAFKKDIEGEGTITPYIEFGRLILYRRNGQIHP